MLPGRALLPPSSLPEVVSIPLKGLHASLQVTLKFTVLKFTAVKRPLKELRVLVGGQDGIQMTPEQRRRRKTETGLSPRRRSKTGLEAAKSRGAGNASGRDPPC